MSKYGVLIASLGLALVGTNAWWAYRTLDAGITNTYARASHDTTSELLAQTVAVLPVAASATSTKADVIAAAVVPNDTVGPYEKEGFVWVGQLGLRFSDQGRLVAVAAGPGGAEK